MKHFSRFNCARSRQEHWGLCSDAWGLLPHGLHQSPSRSELSASAEENSRRERNGKSKRGNPTPLAPTRVFLGVNIALIFRLRLFSAPTVSSVLYTFGNSSLMLTSTCFMPPSVEGQFPRSQEMTAEGGNTCPSWGLKCPSLLCPRGLLKSCGLDK